MGSRLRAVAGAIRRARGPTQRISDAMEEVDVVYTSDVFGLAHVMPPLWHAHRTVPPCSRSEKTSQHLLRHVDQAHAQKIAGHTVAD